MSKRSFRTRRPGRDEDPSYPTLDVFDGDRRSFLSQLGGLILGATGAGLALSGCSNRPVAVQPDGGSATPDMDDTQHMAGGAPAPDAQIDDAQIDDPDIDLVMGEAPEPDARIDYPPAGDAPAPDAQIDNPGKAPMPDAQIDMPLAGNAPAPDAQVDKPEPPEPPEMGLAPPMPSKMDAGSCPNP